MSLKLSLLAFKVLCLHYIGKALFQLHPDICPLPWVLDSSSGKNRIFFSLYMIIFGSLAFCRIQYLSFKCISQSVAIWESTAFASDFELQLSEHIKKLLCSPGHWTAGFLAASSLAGIESSSSYFLSNAAPKFGLICACNRIIVECIDNRVAQFFPLLWETVNIFFLHCTTNEPRNAL